MIHFMKILVKNVPQFHSYDNNAGLNRAIASKNVQRFIDICKS